MTVRLDSIGLRKFTTAPLLLELLGPVSFLMVIILQLHYFHKDFLRISSLDRFKKYTRLLCCFITELNLFATRSSISDTLSVISVF